MRGTTLIASIVAVAALAGCIEVQPPVVPEPEPEPPQPAVIDELEPYTKFPELRFTTAIGDVRMLLYTDWLPTTTGHISDLVERGFYDNTIIHRVVDDFVIQGGDPTGTGEGGSGPAGTSDMIPLEIKAGLQFGSGAVGLARWTDDTGDSQWFIAEKPALHLNDPQGTTGDVFGAYSLFAQVFDGLEVVREIAEVDTLPNDRPVADVILHSARVLPPPTDVDVFALNYYVTEPFDSWMARDATLETPRLGVAGHPVTIRLIVPTPTDFAGNDLPCSESVAQGNMIAFREPFADTPEVIRPDWQRTVDSCTFEASYVPPAEGDVTFMGTDSPRQGVAGAVSIPIHGWHDDYAKYTGMEIE